MSDVSVARVEGVGMVTLRGDIEMLARASSVATPSVRHLSRQGADALLWMSPDELLLVCEDAAARADQMSDNLGDVFATVANVSDARAVFDITGQNAAGVLAKLMPVDFAAFGPDEVRRSRLAQVPAAVWREGEAWRVVCFRSVADYVEAALRNAAADPVGFTVAP